MDKAKILFQIKHLNKTLDIDFSKRLEVYDLTPQQGRIILFICDNYEKMDISQKMCETIWRLSKSTVSGLIKRLEAKSLITITRIKKEHILKPTEEGLKIRDAFIENRKKVIAKLLEKMSDEEINLISDYFAKMITNIEKEDYEC